jgi:hypothetical protein
VTEEQKDKLWTQAARPGGAALSINREISFPFSLSLVGIQPEEGQSNMRPLMWSIAFVQHTTAMSMLYTTRGLQLAPLQPDVMTL